MRDCAPEDEDVLLVSPLLILLNHNQRQLLLLNFGSNQHLGKSTFVVKSIFGCKISIWSFVVDETNLEIEADDLGPEEESDLLVSLVDEDS